MLGAGLWVVWDKGLTIFGSHLGLTGKHFDHIGQMYPCRQHQERKGGHYVPGRNPQLDNPSLNILMNHIDIEASVAGKTGDKAEPDIVASFEAEAACTEAAEAGTETRQAAERGTEACFLSSTEVVHRCLRNTFL